MLAYADVCRRLESRFAALSAANQIRVMGPSGVAAPRNALGLRVRVRPIPHRLRPEGRRRFSVYIAKAYWYKSTCLLVQEYLLTGTKVLAYLYKSTRLLVQKYWLTGTKVLAYWYKSTCSLVQKCYKGTCPRRRSCPSHTRPCRLAGAIRQ